MQKLVAWEKGNYFFYVTILQTTGEPGVHFQEVTMPAIGSQRTVREYSHLVDGKAEQVFPLLCPTREYDWIPSWECQMIYSDSGYVENNCIFTTQLPGYGKGTWVVSRYDPSQFVVEFIIFYADWIERLEIKIIQVDHHQSSLCWIRTYTGLTEKGNLELEDIADRKHAQMPLIDELLNHYCRTDTIATSPR